MKTPICKLLLLGIFFIFNTTSICAQVGINTTDPEGALDIVSTDQGVVMPRVSAVENVVTPDGNPAVDGTIVYDLSRQQMCMRIAGAWICTDNFGTRTPIYDNGFTNISAYIKASNTNANDQFGEALSISADGNYIAISAHFEASNAAGINGDQTNNSSFASGAVYVYQRNGSTWLQQAYIKGSNTTVGDRFGGSLDLNSDGTYLVVSATREASNATGVNGNETDDSEFGAGAVYVFTRSGTTWSQQAYLKASNTSGSDQFGTKVEISNDANYIAVSATGEDSNATGINGDESNNAAASSGAVYIFTRSGVNWSQQAYIKASNTEATDFFGNAMSINADGSYLAVGAQFESSNATGVNGDETNNITSFSGAAYIFTRSGTIWTQQAYIKASNTELSDLFGTSISINDDGSYLAVSATNEDSNATNINGNEGNNSFGSSGAVYLFLRSGNSWSQIAYIKASNTNTNDFFGTSVALSGDGSRLVIAATGESSSATDLNGDQFNNDISNSGAVYSYSISGATISFNGYIKATNTGDNDSFGHRVALNSDGSRLVVSTVNEDSNATGIGGDQNNNLAGSSGAAYVIE